MDSLKDIIADKTYRYEARIIDESNDEVIATISAFDQEGLEMEMGKTKWTNAIERYEIDAMNAKAEAQAEALEEMEYEGKN